MKLAVVFRPAAQEEFIDAAGWYESRRIGLGDEFISEIEHCVTRAAEQPLIFEDVHHGIRRVTAERFPYNVYFRADARRVVVLAVFHSSREPMVWQKQDI